MADGGVVRTLGSVNLCMKIGTDSLSMEHKMVVAPVGAPMVESGDIPLCDGQVAWQKCLSILLTMMSRFD